MRSGVYRTLLFKVSAENIRLSLACEFTGTHHSSIASQYTAYALWHGEGLAFSPSVKIPVLTSTPASKPTNVKGTLFGQS